MRILFFSPQQLWPVNSGSRLRNAHLAGALAKRCQVTLLQILQPEEHETPAPEPQSFERLVSVRKGKSYSAAAVAKGIIGPWPLTVLNYRSEHVAEALREVLSSSRYDAVQVEASNLFSYMKIIREASGKPAIVFDWHNVDSELMHRYGSETSSLPKKLVAWRTASLLNGIERTLIRTCDAHTVVSALDRTKLLRHDPAADITVIPNGVDSQKFSARPGGNSGDELLFVGSMDYHANSDAVLWFVRHAWPDIARRFPMLKFNVVGRSPGPEVRALASDRVRVTGTVEDVRPYYENALAVVVPLRVGGGTRLKILEAMAMGVPVISTSIGAEGIESRSGMDILLADSTEETINAIDLLTTDLDARKRLANAGRALASNHYDWEMIGERLYRVHAGLLAKRG